MIARKNTGYSTGINPSAKFVSVAKSVNPQTEFFVKPSLKIPKPRAGYSLEVNEPPRQKDIKPFSKNF